MAVASDFLDYTEEQEQRKAFRRFIEDNCPEVAPEDLNIKYNRFVDTYLEYQFVGWAMARKARLTGVAGNRLGYVKTQVNKEGQHEVTSFTTVHEDGYQPIRLDN